MQLNNSLLQLICLRFADANYDIDFDDYLTCIVRLENMFSRLKSNRAGMLKEVELTPFFFLSQPGIFKAMDTSKRGRVRMNVMQVNSSCCFNAHLRFGVQPAESLAAL